MPRVKQKKMRLGLDPKRLYKETVIHFSFDNRTRSSYRYGYDNSKERFYVDLRKLLPRVADALGVETVRGETLEAAEKAFAEAMERFKNLNRVINRVILYSIKVGPLPKEHQRYREFHTPSHALVVDIWAGTYEETKAIAGDGVERYSYTRIDEGFFLGDNRSGSYVTNRNGERNEHQIPWTKQNEAFFLWIKERMEGLILALADLVQPEQLIDSINAGRLLPLGKAER